MRAILGLLLTLAAAPVHAAHLSPLWTLDGTYSRRWMAGALVGTDGRTQVRSGLLASASGVLVLADLIRHPSPRSPLYGGAGVVVSTEPSTGHDYVRRDDEDEDGGPTAYRVTLVRERAEETHAGIYVVGGFHGTVPDRPNAMCEVRLLGLDDGARVAVSFGVRF
jgi:hypothetical protein